MTTETKKRLLISKWRGVMNRAEVDRSIVKLLDGVDRISSLVAKLAQQDDEIATLKADLKEAGERIEELEAELDGRDDELTAALERVKYWLHDGIVHGKLVSDPRRLLRTIEDVLP